jgi:hypothetical protein
LIDPQRPDLTQADPLPTPHLPFKYCNHMATKNAQILANEGKGRQSKTASSLIFSECLMVAKNRCKG